MSTIEVIGPTEGLGFVVKEIWVALFLADDGDESVPAVHHPETGMLMPLIAADPKRLEWLKEHATEIARLSGKPVTIVRFSAREDLEVLR